MWRIDARALANLAGLLAIFVAGTAHGQVDEGPVCWVRATASQLNPPTPWSEWYPDPPGTGCMGPGAYSACCEVFPDWVPNFGGPPVECLGPHPSGWGNCYASYMVDGHLAWSGFGVMQDHVCSPTDFFRRDTAQCIAAKADKDPQSCPRTPNPISLANRNKFEAETDLELPGGLRIGRTYNSKHGVRGWGQI